MRGVTFEEYDTRSMKADAGIAIAPGTKSAWFTDIEDNTTAGIQPLEPSVP